MFSPYYFNSKLLLKISTKIQAIQIDGDGEFWALTKISQHEIHHRFFCPYTHDKQDKVELKHHHIVETCLSLMAHRSIALKY